MSRHTARKRFGQHFLTDAGVIDAIVRAVDPRPGERLVEIGPGLGALTRPLADRAGRLQVIELDRDLAARLRRQAALEVVEADVLKVDFRALAAAAGFFGRGRLYPVQSSSFQDYTGGLTAGRGPEKVRDRRRACRSPRHPGLIVI